MKKIIVTALTAIAFTFSGCSSNSPEGAVENLYEALAKGDQEQMQKYSTPQAYSLMSMASAMMSPEQKAALQDGVEIINVEKQGDHLAVVESKTSDGATHKDTVIEMDGQWKVDVKK